MIFIERLMQSLEKKHVTQAELAKVIGLRRTTISDWKKNGNYPPMDVGFKIAYYLDVSPEWLALGEERTYSEEEMSIITMYRKLTPVQKGLVRERIESYMDEMETVEKK